MAAWWDEARAMKAADPSLTHAEIARRFGVQGPAVTRALNPDLTRARWAVDNARRNKAKQEWGRQHRPPCPRCSGPMDRRDHAMCAKCVSEQVERRILTAISLRNEHGLSNREIAERVDATPQAVADLLSRARGRGIEVARDPYMTRRRETRAA